MARLSDINLHDIGNTITLAGGVWTGNGKAYLVMFPEDSGYVESLHGTPHLSRHLGGPGFDLEELDLSREDWDTFLRQTDVMETEILAKASDGTLAKVIVRKSQRQIAQNVSWRVFKRDGYACRYCGNDDTPLTVDHLVLWEAGGPSTVENLVSACRPCNKARGNTPYEEWLNHSFYIRVSQNLTPEGKRANQELLSVIPQIPRLIHKRSR